MVKIGKKFMSISEEDLSDKLGPMLRSILKR
jgi:hypothetical protein